MNETFARHAGAKYAKQIKLGHNGRLSEKTDIKLQGKIEAIPGVNRLGRRHYSAPSPEPQA